MNETNYWVIAGAMAVAATDVLWPARAVWLPAKRGKPLNAKVGSGLATYFRPSQKQDLIVFGHKMVASKCTQFAQQWLGYRELKHFNYFNGVASPLNLLAHTVCHEFAHYLQAHFKQRRYGQVHNHAFYEHLTAIFSSGYADKVKQYLVRKHPELDTFTAIAAPVAATPEPLAKPAIKVGDTVRFNNRGTVTEGVVLRLNRKTVSVGAEGKRQAYWRVPYQLLVL